ncbi:MAG: hypothetical protein CMJ89_18770 [Planctomycetes bacterium]|nr:hypothetical protein [Planctomycetota bacterium]
MRTLLLCLCLFHLASAPPAQTDPDEQVRQLLGAIRRKKDATVEIQFQRLAMIGTPKAFEGLKTCCGWLKEPLPLYWAYKSFREFRDHEALSRNAIAFLTTQAMQARRLAARTQASKALGLWGEDALDELEELVVDSRDKAVREFALEPLLTELFYRRDAGSLRVILNNISAGDAFRLDGNLRRFESPACRTIMVEAVLDKKNDPHLRALLTERLVEMQGAEVDLLLQRLISDGEETVQIAAIEGLARRKGVEAAKDRLWKQLTSRKPEVRLAAIVALGQSLVDDEQWVERLFKLSESRDPVSRIGAASGLFELRSERAIDTLYEMLGDDDWRVRIAALRSVEALRTPRAVETLVHRLGQETGRMRVDVVLSLQSLTGMRFGPNEDRWIAWWNDHEDGYALPAVNTDEGTADSRAIEEASIATFYGLPVFSDRVTIVLDTSGSMSKKTYGLDDYSKGTRVSRLSVARTQLKDLLERIPDGHRINVVLFDDEVNAWMKSVQRITPSSRRELVAFVDREMPDGGTNLYDAIELAMQDELCDTIYVLSDGQPTAGKIVQVDGIRRRILQLNRRANIQFFGVSIGLISDLLRDLALRTQGRYIELGISAEEANSHARRILLREDADDDELLRALELARTATRLEPASSLYRTALGIALFRTGKLAPAMEELQAATTLRGSGNPKVRATRVLFQARIHAKAGEVDQARELLNEGRVLLAGFRDAEIRIFLEWAEAEIP